MGTVIDDPYLVLIEPAEEGVLRSFPLSEGVTRIGRSRGSDIQLRDTAISRHHCHVERRGDEVRVYDEESQNSTWVGSVAIDGQVLKDGDELRLGRSTLVFHSGSVARSGSTPSKQPPPSPRSRRPAGKPSPPEKRARRGRRSLLRWRRRRRLPFLEVSFVLALGVLSVLAAWLYYSGKSDLLGTPGGGEAEVAWNRRPDDEVSRLRAQLASTRGELERREEALRELENQLTNREDAGGSLSGADGARLEELLRQIARLSATERRLDRARLSPPEASIEETLDAYEKGLVESWRDERPEVEIVSLDPGGPPEPGRPPPAAAEPGEMDPAVEQGGRRDPPTVVARVPQPRETRSRANIMELVDTLLGVVDDYATPSTTPDDLEPPLTHLSMTLGKEAARSMLSVHHHARDLLEEIDKNIVFLERRNAVLMREAEALLRKLRRKGYGKPRHGPEMERKQRLLELSDKKIKIKTAQKERLSALRGALLAGVKRLTGTETARYLASHFLSEKDGLERHAILEALRVARVPDVVPILARRLSMRDPLLKAALKQTLVTITGVDLGEQRAPWEKWWRSHRDT